MKLGISSICSILLSILFLLTAGSAFAESKEDNSVFSPDDPCCNQNQSSGDHETSSPKLSGRLTPEDLKGLTPTQSYLKIHDFIMKADSLEQFKPVLSGEALAKTEKGLINNGTETESKSKVDPAVMEAQIFKLMKMMMYPKVKVTSEEINGDKAVLRAVPLSGNIMEREVNSMMDNVSESFSRAFAAKDAKGSAVKETSPPRSTTGIIIMKLEDGVWKQDKEKWHTKIGDSVRGNSSARQADPWCLAVRHPNKVKFANKPAAGTLKGKEFVVNSCKYDSFVNTLTLEGPGKTYSDRQRITIFLFNKKKTPYGETFTCPGQFVSIPHVHVRYHEGPKLKSKAYTGADHYGLRLTFNKAPEKGKLTGFLVLRLPDKEKSEVNGYFSATVK